MAAEGYELVYYQGGYTGLAFGPSPSRLRRILRRLRYLFK